MRDTTAKNKSKTILLMCCKAALMLGITATAANTAAQTLSPKLYKNEKVITFKANSGDTTDAVDGFFHVPENRTNPNSQQIRVNYVRFPAKGNGNAAPIVYLAGGPGGSGIGTAKWRRFPLFEALREFGDVIALDQRGTGASEKTEECVSSQVVKHSQMLNPAAVAESYKRAATECMQKWQQQGVDIYGYTSVQNALDIDDLRKHLGAEKVSLWGISYGSHLALSAIKLFADNIDKVIIASAEGVDQTVKLPAQTDQYFRHVQDVIDQQGLKDKVNDLPALMSRVHNKLDKTPISISVNYRNGESGTVLFQSTHMKMLASMMIADPNQYLSMLIQTYVELDAGGSQMVSNIISRGMFQDGPLRFKLMPLAMDIASGVSQERMKRVKFQAESALLGEYLNFPMPMLNMLDPKLDLGSEFRMNPQSDVPTLLFSGTLDGRTYPEEQREAVSGLTNVTHIKVKHAGHNLYTSSPDVLARMKTFMRGQAVPTNDIELPLPNLSGQ